MASIKCPRSVIYKKFFNDRQMAVCSPPDQNKKKTAKKKFKYWAALTRWVEKFQVDVSRKEEIDKRYKGEELCSSWLQFDRNCAYSAKWYDSSVNYRSLTATTKKHGEPPVQTARRTVCTNQSQWWWTVQHCLMSHLIESVVKRLLEVILFLCLFCHPRPCAFSNGEIHGRHKVLGDGGVVREEKLPRKGGQSANH